MLKTTHDFLLFLGLLFILIGCSSSQPEKITLFSGTEMTINYRILIGSPIEKVHKMAISKIIRKTFDEVNQIYNKWNPESELSGLNRLKAGIQVPLSSELESLLLLTDKIVHLSDGRFDPTIEPLQTLWKKNLEQGHLPLPSELESISQAIGWNKIHFEKGLFYKDADLTSLDLGGIAKGYCVDLLVLRLNQAGFQNVFVEWGGEIRASGQHPDERLWNIFISHLGNPNPQDAVAIVSLNNQAMATSGDYLQNWTVKGEGNAAQNTTYFHIMNPKNFQPLISSSQSIASASVLAPSCAFADGLATAAMMFPTVQEAKEWADGIKQQFPELEFWIISRKN